jgi:hypothetical protein
MVLESLGFLFQNPEAILKIRDVLRDILSLEQEIVGYFRNKSEWKQAKAKVASALSSASRLYQLIERLPADGLRAIAAVDEAGDPVNRRDFKRILQTGTVAFDDLRDLSRETLQFAKECNDIARYSTIMEVLERNSPESFEVIQLFARSYDPSRRVLSLDEFPTFIRMFGDKIGWRNESEESKIAEELMKEAQPIVEKAKRLHLESALARNYGAIIKYMKSFKRLTRITYIKAKPDVIAEMKQSSPSWYTKLVEMVEDASKTLKEAIEKSKQSKS